MKRIIFITLVIIALLVSCKPIEYPDKEYSSFSKEEIENFDPNWGVDATSKRAVVSFSPVGGAKKYTLKVTQGNTERKYTVPSSAFRNGRFVYTIKGLSPSTQYSLSLRVDRDETGVDIKKTKSFETSSSSGEELEYSPYAYVVKRDENSVRVHVDKASNIFYRVLISESGNSLSIPREVFSDGEEYEINGIAGDKSYTVTVQHGRRAGVWSKLSTTLEINPYEYEVVMTLSRDDDKFSLSDAEGIDSLYLIRLGDKSFSYKIDTSSFEIPRSLLESMQRSEYCAIGKRGEEIVISNAVSYTSPIIAKYTSYPDSIILNWESRDEEIIYNVSILEKSNGTVSDVETESGYSEVKIEGLQSNTSYDIIVEGQREDGSTVKGEFKVTTDSYEGTYIWQANSSGIGAKNRSFIVDVEKAPENSDYPYYIYVNSKDPAFQSGDKNYRLMPLVDKNDPNDDKYFSLISSSDSMISYSSDSEDFMKAYRWNEKKWNTSPFSPISWRVGSNKIEGDKVTTKVETKAPMVGMVTTTTAFSFRVRNGEKQLVFTNQADKALANSFIFKNPDAKNGENQFEFVLSYMGKEGAL